MMFQRFVSLIQPLSNIREDYVNNVNNIFDSWHFPVRTNQSNYLFQTDTIDIGYSLILVHLS